MQEEKNHRHCLKQEAKGKASECQNYQMSLGKYLTDWLIQNYLPQLGKMFNVKIQMIF